MLDEIDHGKSLGFQSELFINGPRNKISTKRYSYKYHLAFILLCVSLISNIIVEQHLLLLLFNIPLLKFLESGVLLS